jgi:cysteine desulfurase
VLETVLALQKQYAIQVDFVAVKPNGEIDLTHLVELLAEDVKSLVSLMHVNNEIGTILDLERVGVICKEHKVLFHSDTVQSIGKMAIDLQSIAADFIVASAHKFHGPKGVGFAFVRKNSGLQPLFHGGEQEKGVRAGTEALHQIAGMAKALSVSYDNLERDREYISSLRSYLMDQLDQNFKGYKINGCKAGFYNMLNVQFPFSEDKTAMILFHLDMKGIAVSRGSACQSGTIKPSHVLEQMLSTEDVKKPSLRISFSQFNTKNEIDQIIAALKTI